MDEWDQDEPVVVVCQGPPRCDLVGDEAIRNQRDGCKWCEHYYIDGTVKKPGEA